MSQLHSSARQNFFPAQVRLVSGSAEAAVQAAHASLDTEAWCRRCDEVLDTFSSTQLCAVQEASALPDSTGLQLKKKWRIDAPPAL